MPRLVNTCVLAAIVIFLLITFTAFLRSPNAPAPHPGDDSLEGAFDQIPAKNQPPVSIVYDPPVEELASTKQQPKKQDSPKNKELKNEVPKKEEQKQPQKPKLAFPQQQKTFDVPAGIVYDKAGPKPEQVVLLAASDGKGHNGGIPNLLEYAKENREEYARLHGYHFNFIDITRYDLNGAHPVWAKLPAIVDSFNDFPEAQWVWWLDLDAIIMSPQIDLNSHILSYSAMHSRLEKNAPIIGGGGHKTNLFTPKEYDVSQIDIIISQDHNGLNAGSFFIRRSAFSKWLMDLWSDPQFINSKWEGKEQDALLNLVINHKSVRDHVGYVNQRVINAYPVGGSNMGWYTGDLVVHFAGCWVEHKCAAQFEDFWNRRKTAEQVRKESKVTENLRRRRRR